MSYRPHGRALVDPSDPRAFGRCDRCGFWYNLRELQWQLQWQGTQIINTGSLVCADRCLDDLQPQLKAIILPPDPVPVMNARVEPFAYDETDWLVTEDGNPIVTQDGVHIITQVPNPADAANQANLTTLIPISSSALSSLYVDLLGPGGASILEVVTGDATRPNVLASMAVFAATGANIYPIVFTTSALAQANVVTAALYAAASGGSALASAPVGVSSTLISAGAQVQFLQGNLRLTIS